MAKRILLITLWITVAPLAFAAPQGVTDDTIRIGQYSDLSGPAAIWGVGTTYGTRMRLEEANAAGGVNGRMFEFIVEDAQYQVPLAVKAANKLLNRDKVFVMVGNLGTPHNNATMPRQLKMGVPNLFPLTAAVAMYEPLHPMKFSYFVSYRDQAGGAINYMVKKTGASKVCLQTQATDYGQEVEIGYENAVEKLGLESVYVGRHKVTETDFVGSVTALKNTGCEILFIGTIIKDTILLYTTARKAGWNVPIVGNMVVLHPTIAEAADGGMEGLYGAAPFRIADFESGGEENAWRRDWYRRYKERFNEEPSVQSQIGYVITDLTVKAIDAAGRDLTTEKVLEGIENIRDYEDPFGGPSLSFGPDKHQGSDALMMSQVIGGKWVVVEEELPY